MKKTIIIFSILLLTLTCNASSRLKYEYEMKKYSIYLIAAKKDNGEITIGTAFALSNHGWLVTANHVIQGCSSVKNIAVSDINDNVFMVQKIVSVDTVHDLVILDIKTPTKALPIAQATEAQVGEDLYMIGNPVPVAFSLFTGVISYVNKEVAGRDLYQTTTPFSPGASGAPVFDEQGNVTCIVRSRLENLKEVNFCTPVKYLRNMKMLKQ